MILRSIMSDIKNYYYIKLKENHFDSDEMIVLESMSDGYKYSNILLKLYLRSLKNNGKLMLNDRIPFNSTMLANVTRHSVGDIEKAVSIFENLGLIEVLNNGAIYMNDIQNFIGHSSTEADRKRAYRGLIETEKKKLKPQKTRGTNVRQMSDKYPPEIELEKEKELDIKTSLFLSPEYEEEKNTFKTLKELKQYYIKTFDNSGKIFEKEHVGGYIRLTIRGGYLHNLETNKDLTGDEAIEIWNKIYAVYLNQKSAS